MVNQNLQAVIDGTNTDGGGTVLTGEAISHVRVVSLILGLAFEIKTGMKMTRFPLTRVAESYGVFAKTKKKCLREMLAWYENFYGVPYESDAVKEALS
ncbi:hypothetical protein UFOVP658_39 [uncultured Caudovirales phage]|uniref:Uncharacterized protein n=1 Tax=uncultured Caudovirales phage TaxID=2100421 RepID=A0A6J5NBA0_9CAUD|nr:hypothetical protein UFOVP658_39 [uncultured Caudovirales phage]